MNAVIFASGSQSDEAKSGNEKKQAIRRLVFSEKLKYTTYWLDKTNLL